MVTNNGGESFSRIPKKIHQPMILIEDLKNLASEQNDF